MSDLSEQDARTLIDATARMLEVWSRLSIEKQQTLLARFGTREKAVAALVATRMVAKDHPA